MSRFNREEIKESLMILFESKLHDSIGGVFGECLRQNLPELQKMAKEICTEILQSKVFKDRLRKQMVDDIADLDIDDCFYEDTLKTFFAKEVKTILLSKFK